MRGESKVWVVPSGLQSQRLFVVQVNKCNEARRRIGVKAEATAGASCTHRRSSWPICISKDMAFPRHGSVVDHNDEMSVHAGGQCRRCRQCVQQRVQTDMQMPVLRLCGPTMASTWQSASVHPPVIFKPPKGSEASKDPTLRDGAGLQAGWLMRHGTPWAIATTSALLSVKCPLCSMQVA